MKELKGKVAVVTGAASGLGRAMALAFADAGMNVALADVSDTSDVFASGAGHVVNTASVAGIINPPGSAAYNVTKHAVVALSETLHHDLRERGSAVGVSVLCPAYVPTGIADSERNRPAAFSAGSKSPETLARE